MVRSDVKEKELFKHYKLIAGVDEAGRGAWAGPLVAGAVLLPAGFYQRRPSWTRQADDSKKLSPATRHMLFEQIKKDLVWSVGLVSSREIDRQGVGSANCLAVERAVVNLSVRPEFILSDYIARLPAAINRIPTSAMVKGDARFLAIALASIVAKAYRDDLMIGYETTYPGYGLGQHKGYGTFKHQAALSRLGVCPLHRTSYRPVAKYLI